MVVLAMQFQGLERELRIAAPSSHKRQRGNCSRWLLLTRTCGRVLRPLIQARLLVLCCSGKASITRRPRLQLPSTLNLPVCLGNRGDLLRKHAHTYTHAHERAR